MSKSSSNIYYNLLKDVSVVMKAKGYYLCLSPNIQGVNPDDTGAVIAVTLYFIKNEPKINKKKIKCYLLLLDRICQYKGRGKIFRWQLSPHFIQKFIDALINFMKEKQIIRLSGNSKSQLVVNEVPDLTYIKEKVLPLIPPNVLGWLNSILDVCKKKTGQDMENSMFPSTKTKMTKTAKVKQLQDTIDKNTRTYSKQYSAVSSEDSAFDATVKECIKLIEEHEADAKN